MRTTLASTGLLLLFCSVAHAQSPQRGKAVEDCKSELGSRFQRPALLACVERKMDAARASGKVKPKTGEACKFSSSGKKC